MPRSLSFLRCSQPINNQQRQTHSGFSASSPKLLSITEGTEAGGAGLPPRPQHLRATTCTRTKHRLSPEELVPFLPLLQETAPG